jgi:hypothetical protein
MRGGEIHELVPNPGCEDREQRDLRLKYARTRCGEPYQVRTSAPSCRIRGLEQMEHLEAPFASLAPAARRAALEELLRRRLKWPRPFRDAMLDQFERWRAWKASVVTDPVRG